MSRSRALDVLGIAVAVATTVFGTGCGTMISGSTARVPITTEPRGAEIWIDGQYVGRSPLRATVRSSQRHLVVFRAPGHATQAVVVEPRVQGAYVILDVFFTGLIGIVIDAATKGWYEPSPDRIHLRLPRVAIAEPERPPPGVAPPPPPASAEPPQVTEPAVESPTDLPPPPPPPGYR